MDDLFSPIANKLAPLAERMRPRTLDEFIGQPQLVGPGRLLRRAIQNDSLTSSIFYGPPGSGKTTLANIIANTTGAAFEKLNAVSSGVKEVREVIAAAADRLRFHSQHTYLLLDECHRWSKTQSDSVLPALEKGLVRFIGSTTENPMVSMTGAIVSRCRLFRFERLGVQDVRRALAAALEDKERGLGARGIIADEDALDHLAHVSNGDARTALNALELAANTTDAVDGGVHITLAVAEESIQRRAALLDDDQMYDMLSAFCKSLRGSDADAALLWFSRLIYAGMDPRIIARRVIVHASEDVGMANPQAMVQAVAAADALEFIGMPEARLALAQAIIYVCESPKSPAVVRAVSEAMADAERDYHKDVPPHLRDTHYGGAQKLGHGEGYKFPHDYPGGYVEQQYMPDGLKRSYYRPTAYGNERTIRENRRTRGIVDGDD